MQWWRILGVAGFAGVAAGGVLIARDERRRLNRTPDEIRDLLRARVADAHPAEDAGGTSSETG